ncbi:MAG: M67 family metallopeptidase [Planctomycetota bacterium]
MRDHASGGDSRLHLPPDLRRELEAEVRRGYPREVCGLLLGRAEGRTHRVVRLTQARNLDAANARVRYRLAPEDFLRADAEARALRLDVVGIWHSHPDHPAQPSQLDLDSAWDGYSYLIASVGEAGVEELRSWCLQGHRFVEEKIDP